MNRIKHLYLSVALAAGSGPTQGDELSDTGVLLDGIAAIVNEGVVLKSELDRNMAMIVARAREQDIEIS